MFRIVPRSAGFFAAFFVFSIARGLQAQTLIVDEPGYKPTLTFDVATIRQSPPPDANFHVSVSSPTHSSRFEAKNLPMQAMLQIAYGYDDPIAGGPDWLTKTLYDVQARSDEAADARLAKLTDNQVRLEKRNAIRVLLAERLELKTHIETRSTAVYNLVVGKGGVKMAVAPPPAVVEGEAPKPLPPVNIQAHGSQHGLEFVATNAGGSAITSSLSSMVELPVINKTALTGSYNYTLQFGREWSAHDPDSWPSIFTAVQEQLGLKLEPAHESVPNIVIDHITKPTEN